jgi:GxxExxY protein
LLTEHALGAVFEVSNTLGSGFLEKVYERALLMELGIRGIRHRQPKAEWKRIVFGFEAAPPCPIGVHLR